jgi:L-threonylcarbamoyladenylate synthase
MADRPNARVLPADPAHGEAYAAAIAEGAARLRAGGLVAFPTETVYGLGANALDAAAVRAIYAAKGRPSFNPLIVHLADVGWLPRVVREVPPVATLLAAAFWPGPLTLVLPRASTVPDEVTAGLDTVGVRVPAHAVARDLIAAADLPIAAPSANAYTRVSPTTAAHVVQQLGDRVDLVLDGGPAAVGIESTVLDLTTSPPTLLRPGGVSHAELERVLGPVARLAKAPQGEAPRRSPGLVDRHYAPRARLQRFPATERAGVFAELRQRTERGERTGLLAFDTDGAVAVCVQRLPRDPVGCARALYAALHALDAAGCTFAAVEALPAGAAWEAVADRLARAGLGNPPA